MPTTRSSLNHQQQPSAAELLASLSESERQKVLMGMTEDQIEKLLYDWSFWGRPKQQEPTDVDWFVWLYLAGRGSGKTRAGAEWIRKRVETGQGRRIAMIGETVSDVRDVMVLGESGIINSSPPWFRPTYSPANKSVTWPNGAFALLYSGEDPDQLRGPQFDTAWVDELAKFYNPQAVWDNLEFGLRLGNPRVIVTTTPRPIPIIKDMIRDPDVRVTTGSSYENLSNLSPRYIKRVIKKYEGTRLGEQELHAKVLEDLAGALWTTDMIERNRMRPERLPYIEFIRVVVAIDPSTKKSKDGREKGLMKGQGVDEEEANETGIIVAGKDRNGIAYVLRDRSGQYTPDGWARAAVKSFDDYKAHRIVAERNQGGAMVESTIRTVRGNIPYIGVWAADSKGARAEPVAALQEQNKIKFVGNFPELENQLTSMTAEGYLGRGSPDRLDAFVWAMTELLIGSVGSTDPDDYADTQAA